MKYFFIPLNQREWNTVFCTALQIIFGILFVFSSITKFIDLESFSNSINDFHILGKLLIPIFSYLVPSVELIFGIMIILNINTYYFSYLTILMVALFTALVSAKLLEGVEVSCGCFGMFGENEISGKTILRNLFLIVWGIIIYLIHHPNFIQSDFNSSLNNKHLRKKFRIVLKKFLIQFVFFFLAINVIILSLQNYTLKSRVVRLITPSSLEKGHIVSAFGAINLNNDFSKIGFENYQFSLIFLFKSTCSPCKKNVVFWEKIYNSYSNMGQILALSLDSLDILKTYMLDNVMNYPTYLPVDADFQERFQAYITPQTMLIDSNKSVLHVWRGVMEYSHQKELINLIDSNLRKEN
jgi:uncharacterized membrane protein YphA (DoxX/SURF4 family)/peroxiredoxin